MGDNDVSHLFRTSMAYGECQSCKEGPNLKSSQNKFYPLQKCQNLQP